MPNFAEEPLTKVTLNIYERDMEYIKARFGWGYSEHLRKVIREWVNEMKVEDEDDG